VNPKGTAYAIEHLNNGEEPVDIVFDEDSVTAIVGNYVVFISNEGVHCDCMDFKTRKRLCKHLIFLILWLDRNKYSIPEGVYRWV